MVVRASGTAAAMPEIVLGGGPWGHSAGAPSRKRPRRLVPRNAVSNARYVTDDDMPVLARARAGSDSSFGRAVWARRWCVPRRAQAAPDSRPSVHHPVVG